VKSDEPDAPIDFSHCIVCRMRGYVASGEWFHYNQHLKAAERTASKLRHPSQQQPADDN